MFVVKSINADGILMKENISLKRSLILQSFAPLFILLFIKHFYFCMPSLFLIFVKSLKYHRVLAFKMAFEHPLFWDAVLASISAGWLILTLIISLGFRGIQNSGFASKGENIVVSENKSDVGISFLVSFVLPLLVDEVASLRDFIFFLVLLAMVIILLTRSNLYYQNPVLSFLGYKVCTFAIVNPAKDVEEFVENKEFIGITRGKNHNGQSDYKTEIHR